MWTWSESILGFLSYCWMTSSFFLFPWTKVTWTHTRLLRLLTWHILFFYKRARKWKLLHKREGLWWIGLGSRLIHLCSCLMDDSSCFRFICGSLIETRIPRESRLPASVLTGTVMFVVHRASLFRSQLDLMLQHILAGNSNFWVIPGFYLFKLAFNSISHDRPVVLIHQLIYQGRILSFYYCLNKFGLVDFCLLSLITRHCFLCCVFVLPTMFSQHFFHVCLRTCRLEKLDRWTGRRSLSFHTSDPAQKPQAARLSSCQTCHHAWFYIYSAQ